MIPERLCLLRTIPHHVTNQPNSQNAGALTTTLIPTLMGTEATRVPGGTGLGPFALVRTLAA
jgi:hypothetical protein